MAPVKPGNSPGVEAVGRRTEPIRVQQHLWPHRPAGDRLSGNQNRPAGEAPEAKPCALN